MAMNMRVLLDVTFVLLRVGCGRAVGVTVLFWCLVLLIYCVMYSLLWVMYVCVCVACCRVGYKYGLCSGRLLRAGCWQWTGLGLTV